MRYMHEIIVMENKITIALDSKLSTSIYISRFFAILSVVTAHCRLDSLNYIVNVFQNIGTIGVGFFFFCSGLYFNTKIRFNKHLIRLTHILVPWIVGSSMIWFEVNIRKNDFSAISWLKHFIGFGSIFYFFTIYFIFILFTSLCLDIYSNYFKRNNNLVFYILIIGIALSILSCYFENNSFSLFFCPYLNPFIFAPYYLLGLFFNCHKTTLQLLISNKLSCFFIVILLTVFLSVHLYYWNYLYIFLEFFYIFALINISWLFIYYFSSSFLVNLMLLVGKNSLFVYILHLIPVTFLNYLGKKYIFFEYTYILWPTIVLFLFFLFILGAKKFSFCYLILHRYMGLR